jgi:hypothetical protein
MTKHCTDTTNYKKFRPHGRVEISTVDNKIAVFRALGPFNLELLDALQQIEPVALQAMDIENNSWVEIVVFEQSCLASDELFAEFCLHLTALKASGFSPVASAFVFTDEIDGTLLMLDKYRKCFADAGLVFNDFNNETDAMEWVRSFL